MGLSQAGISNEESAKSQAEQTDERIARECAALESVALRNCIQEQFEAEANRRQSEQDLRAQQTMARFTAFMGYTGIVALVIGGFSIYLIWDTLRATREMANDTRRIGEAQVRAYLTLENANVIPRTNEPNRVFWHLHFTLRNCGQSPARKITVEASGDLFSANGHSVVPNLAAGGEILADAILTTRPDALRFMDADQTMIMFRTHLAVRFSDVFARSGERTTVRADFVGMVHVVDGETAHLTGAGTAISEPYYAGS